MLSDAEKLIAAQMRSSEQLMKVEVTDQVVAQARKLIAEKINSADQNKLVDDYIRHIGE